MALKKLLFSCYILCGKKGTKSMSLRDHKRSDSCPKVLCSACFGPLRKEVKMSMKARDRVSTESSLSNVCSAIVHSSEGNALSG